MGYTKTSLSSLGRCGCIRPLLELVFRVTLETAGCEIRGLIITMNKKYWILQDSVKTIEVQKVLEGAQTFILEVAGSQGRFSFSSFCLLTYLFFQLLEFPGSHRYAYEFDLLLLFFNDFFDFFESSLFRHFN